MSIEDAGPPPAETEARRLIATATADAGISGSSAVLQRICRAARTGLSVRGCAIHLTPSSGTANVAASSDSWSSQVADLAFTTGEGPSIDALAQRRPVLVGDLAREVRRWPGFSSMAAEMGVRAFFSFPLLSGVPLGALDLYATRPRTLQDEEASLALTFAELASHTVLGEPIVFEDGTWEPLLDHRSEIHQAQGMVMVDLDVPLAEALIRMRAHAFALGIPVIDLAQAIIAGFALPSSESELS